MSPENFVYWVQGLFELGDVSGHPVKTLNEAQVKMIKQHLGYVFTHVESVKTLEAMGAGAAVSGGSPGTGGGFLGLPSGFLGGGSIKLC